MALYEQQLRGAFLDNGFLDPVDPGKVLKLVIAQLAARRRRCSGRVQRFRRGTKT